jgi:hypothetical protein
MNHHIYRITIESKNVVVIAKKPFEKDGFDNEIIASFKNEPLRDHSFVAFKQHIEMNPETYPYHKVRG